MTLNPNELNYMVYRYLLEQNYDHAAFAFYNEADVVSIAPDPYLVPKGLLVALLYKALYILDIEMHVDAKGQLHSCTKPLQVFEYHSCTTAIAVNQIFKHTYMPYPHEESKVANDAFITPKILDSSVILNYMYYDPQAARPKYCYVLDDILKGRFDSAAEIYDNLESEELTDTYSKRQIKELYYLQTTVASMVSKTFGTDSQAQIANDDLAAQDSYLGGCPDRNAPVSITRLYLHILKSQVTVLHLFEAEKLFSISQDGVQQCSCSFVICKCSWRKQDFSRGDADFSLRNFYVMCAGDAYGYVVISMFSYQYYLLSDPKTLLSTAAVNHISVVPHGNRLIILYEDSAVTVLSVNASYDAEKYQFSVKLSYVYCGYPFGCFKISNAQFCSFPEQKHKLIVAGEAGVPSILSLNDMQINRAFDGFESEMFDSTSQTAFQVRATNDFIAVLFKDSRLVFTGTKRSKQPTTLSFSGEPLKLLVFDSSLYIVTKTDTLFKVDMEYKSLVSCRLDMPVIDAVETSQGIACLLGKMIVIMGNIDRGQAQVKFSWDLGVMCTSLHSYDGKMYAFAQEAFVLVDPYIEQAQIISVFPQGVVQTLSRCRGCVAAGSGDGYLWLEVPWAATY